MPQSLASLDLALLLLLGTGPATIQTECAAGTYIEIRDLAAEIKVGPLSD